MKISLVILIIIGYILGMFITKIVVTVYDNSVSGLDSIDDFDVVFMLMWPIMLPLIGLYALFIKLYEIAEDIGNKISIKRRYRKMGVNMKRRNKNEEESNQ